MTNAEILKAESTISPNKILRISIVCYEVDLSMLNKTLASLMTACVLPLNKKFLQGVEIVLVNNGPSNAEAEKIEALLQSIAVLAGPGVHFSILGDGHNLGFGAGHNLAINQGNSDFHLILNPDVELASDALMAALEFMLAHEECGILAPAIYSCEGDRQYLCKRYPTMFDLLVRGFAPKWVRQLFRTRLAKYEMRDVIGDNVVWSPPIVSGCFMLMRTSVLKNLEGFDPGYFLYFEDFDLSLRAAAVTRIAYTPHVKIIHHGGYAAKKGLRHIFMFVRSAIIFFNTHGWKWC